MRVIEVAEFGGPEVLRPKEIADPVPGPNGVRVNVEAIGVLSVDAMIRAGNGGDHFPVRPPYIPGVGVAGTVDATGADVDSSWQGRRVLADIEGGGYAEQVVATTGQLVPVPDGLQLTSAMALLHDGGTALAVFEAVRVGPDDTVLVLPAAGGLGSLLVQLARRAGARVIGAARGAAKRSFVEGLGAHVAVDYGAPDWAQSISDQVSVAFDGVGGELGREALDLVARGGRFSAYGLAGGPPTMVDADGARARGIQAVGMEQLAGYQAGRSHRSARMLELAATGQLTPTVTKTFPLTEAAAAHRHLESRAAIGKVILTTDIRPADPVT